ncbi:hypothetical protein PoB_003024700 [Plakobranchus ocellatus]|uniref:Uncharacterized protein n=1 Tax=Plakobranchus ocellatus TaxID=259542 RepID=A0AAV4A945_9GAST|nr:hypothetical protein PoB_003024700 [Plakobranchus ocellatus]
MTSGEQQVQNGTGRHKIGGNGRHLQRATSCSGWTKPPSNQNTNNRDKNKDSGDRCSPIHSKKKNGDGQDTLLEKNIIDGLKDAHSGNQGQEEEIGADQKQDGWLTSGEQQVQNGTGRHKIGGNGRHLQRATSCSRWTKPPSNQVTK